MSNIRWLILYSAQCQSFVCHWEMKIFNSWCYFSHCYVTLMLKMALILEFSIKNWHCSQSKQHLVYAEVLYRCLAALVWVVTPEWPLDMWWSISPWEVDMLFVQLPLSWAISPEDHSSDGAEALTFLQKFLKRVKPPGSRLPVQAWKLGGPWPKVDLIR